MFRGGNRRLTITRGSVMTSKTTPCTMSGRLRLYWILCFALPLSNTSDSPSTTSLVNSRRNCFPTQLQVIMDDRAISTCVRCSIDLNTVHFVNTKLWFDFEFPAGSDSMATGYTTTLEIQTSAALLAIMLSLVEGLFTEATFASDGEMM